jgi:membrane-bound serine protease (ClpP class)
VINPVGARYVELGVERAARQEARAVVLKLDTPGGTMDAMRDMVKSLLGARVPIVVFVAPEGARAASAGMFVTAAAHVAAMAPGTNIGAAHPVSVGRSGDQSATVEEKALNDAAAMVRAIGQARGRNVEWLERAVRESVSLTAEEARRQDVVDLVAPDLPTLLAAIDGRAVQTAAGRTVLHTRAAAVISWPMSIPERILQVLVDPNIAYLLMSLGVIGLAAELYQPGLIFPGVTGALCVLLALTAFGSLPVNWAGLAFVLLGIGLIVVDALVAGVGLVSIGGAVALVIGSLFLYRPLGPITPADPALAVDPWLIAFVTAAAVGFSALVLRALWRVRRAPIRSGPEALIGRYGVAASELAPAGAVRVDSESWSAVAVDAPLPSGAPIEVVGIEGVTLKVRRGEEAGIHE